MCVIITAPCSRPESASSVRHTAAYRSPQQCVATRVHGSRPHVHVAFVSLRPSPACGPFFFALTTCEPAIPLPPPRLPPVRPVQAIPGDFRIGDAVYSLASHSSEHGSFEPGAKGTVVAPSTTDPDTGLKAQFEGYGCRMEMLLTQISRDPDPNNVSGDRCTERPPCVY